MAELPPPRSSNVLIVEDDPAIGELLELASDTSALLPCAPAQAARRWNSSPALAPDMIILDLGLPGLDGSAVLRAVRERGDTPVLVLTARDGVGERTAHFQAGADDYLVKPFVFGELMARVRAILRHSQPQASGEQNAELGQRNAGPQDRPGGVPPGLKATSKEDEGQGDQAHKLGQFVVCKFDATETLAARNHADRQKQQQAGQAQTPTNFARQQAEQQNQSCVQKNGLPQKPSRVSTKTSV
ncbi:DNA-binding response OmpR family regulator [Deinococcus humi]|uniref:DNA-binding response OmpR family regulator n=1 Tax=Deinococcus humi TaxID=662880 RepID=A0A7W8JYJ9_9DEIO|nr:DNA-binding response OmpR family regulator [Deinococcus humi]GGO36222.1 hypothetical protein GCM10008949_39810 [Deinococcus humi]